MGGNNITMNYLALSLCFLMLAGGLAAVEMEVARSGSRQLALCCGTVTSKCATGCAGKSCDIQCSGRCGILNTLCGPYKCSAVTNACTSSSATTAAATAAACLPTGGYCSVNGVFSTLMCCTGTQCYPDPTNFQLGVCTAV